MALAADDDLTNAGREPGSSAGRQRLSGGVELPCDPPVAVPVVVAQSEDVIAEVVGDHPLSAETDTRRSLRREGILGSAGHQVAFKL